MNFDYDAKREGLVQLNAVFHSRHLGRSEYRASRHIYWVGVRVLYFQPWAFRTSM